MYFSVVLLGSPFSTRLVHCFDSHSLPIYLPTYLSILCTNENSSDFFHFSIPPSSLLRPSSLPSRVFIFFRRTCKTNVFFYINSALYRAHWIFPNFFISFGHSCIFIPSSCCKNNVFLSALEIFFFCRVVYDVKLPSVANELSRMLRNFTSRFVRCPLSNTFIFFFYFRANTTKLWNRDINDVTDSKMDDIKKSRAKMM